MKRRKSSVVRKLIYCIIPFIFAFVNVEVNKMYNKNHWLVRTKTDFEIVIDGIVFGVIGIILSLILYILEYGLRILFKKIRKK